MLQAAALTGSPDLLQIGELIFSEGVERHRFADDFFRTFDRAQELRVYPEAVLYALARHRSAYHAHAHRVVAVGHLPLRCDSDGLIV